MIADQFNQALLLQLLLRRANRVLPFFSETLAVNHSVDAVIAKVWMYGLDSGVNFKSGERAVPLQEIHDRSCENRVHGAASKSQANQLILGFANNGVEASANRTGD